MWQTTEPFLLFKGNWHMELRAELLNNFQIYKHSESKHSKLTFRPLPLLHDPSVLISEGKTVLQKLVIDFSMLKVR